MAGFANPDFGQFRLGESLQAGQNIAMNNYRLGEAARSVQARTGLQSAVQTGTPEAMRQYRKDFPLESQQYDAQTLQLQSQQLQTALGKLSFMGQLASGVSDEPTYQNAINTAKNAGLDVSNAPANYDPNWVKQTQEQVFSAKDRVELQMKSLEMLMRGQTLQETQRHNLAEESGAGKMVEVADPKSPTGTKWVSYSQAVGQPGKPQSGFSIETGPDGTTRIVQGPGAGMQKTTSSEVQKKILSSGDTMSQLKNIERLYRPEFQQLGTRWDNLMTSWKDKAGLDVSEKDKQTLSDFSQYKAEAYQLFALTLKDLSGVAVNPTEFKRAEAWIPNPGTGLFDGDSPTVMASKRQRFEDFTRRALIKYGYINKHGLSVNDLDVNDVPTLVQKRGNELERQYKAQGLSGDSLKRAVRIGLSDEFGFGVIQ